MATSYEAHFLFRSVPNSLLHPQRTLSWRLCDMSSAGNTTDEDSQRSQRAVSEISSGNPWTDMDDDDDMDYEESEDTANDDGDDTEIEIEFAGPQHYHGVLMLNFG